MSANASNFDRLSSALVLTSSPKSEKMPESADRGNPQDSFKSVVQRNEESSKARIKESKSPEALDSKEKKPAPTEKKSASPEPGATKTTQPTERESTAAQDQPADNGGVTPLAQEPGEAIAEQSIETELGPVAELGLIGGEILPPASEALESILPVPAEALLVEDSVTKPSDAAKNPTTVIADIDAASTQVIDSISALDSDKSALLATTTVTDNKPVAQGSANPNAELGFAVQGKPQEKSALKPSTNTAKQTAPTEFIGPIKLTDATAETTAITNTDALRPATLPESFGRPFHSAQSDTPVFADPTLAARAQQAIEASAVNKMIPTSSTEIDVDNAKPTSAGVEPSTLIKLTTPVDQSWVQQFQTINGLGGVPKAGAVQLQLPLNIHNPQWFGAMADRVSWLASQSIQAAEIHLDPPELGPLQVRIAVNHDQASVNFVSHHAAVRDALDSQLVRLRELFSNEGLSLVDVNVSDRHQQREKSQSQNEQGGELLGEDTGAESVSMVPINAITQWVDYYV
jgi:flagellar hook-length control protein FliK